MTYTERQIEIIEAATKRISEHSIQQLTTRNLAADLGLSEPALYRHFKNKEEILEAVLNYFIDGMKGTMMKILVKEMPSSEKICAVLTRQVKLFSQKPAVVSIIFSEGIFQFSDKLSEIVLTIVKFMQMIIEELIKDGQSAGNIRKDIAAENLCVVILGTVRFTVLKWRLENFKYDIVKEGNEMIRTIEKIIKPGQ